MRSVPAIFLLFNCFASAIPQSSEDTSVSAEYTDDTTFQRVVLDVTNLYRRQHNASELSWNESLAEYAKDWSDGCEFEHSGGDPGENLAAGYPNVTASVEAWGNEREEYDFSEGEFASETGHFTQLVWRNTTTVGCARTECDGKNDTPGWYVVCEYHPAGNVIGQFIANVQEQLPNDEVPSGTGQPTPTETAEGAASSIRGSVAALWVALIISFSLSMA